jgi:hypothetical protein
VADSTSGGGVVESRRSMEEPVEVTGMETECKERNEGRRREGVREYYKRMQSPVRDLRGVKGVKGWGIRGKSALLCTKGVSYSINRNILS